MPAASPKPRYPAARLVLLLTLSACTTQIAPDPADESDVGSAPAALGDQLFSVTQRMLSQTAPDSPFRTLLDLFGVQLRSQASFETDEANRARDLEPVQAMLSSTWFPEFLASLETSLGLAPFRERHTFIIPIGRDKLYESLDVAKEIVHVIIRSPYLSALRRRNAWMAPMITEATLDEIEAAANLPENLPPIPRLHDEVSVQRDHLIATLREWWRHTEDPDAEAPREIAALFRSLGFATDRQRTLDGLTAELNRAIELIALVATVRGFRPGEWERINPPPYLWTEIIGQIRSLYVFARDLPAQERALGLVH